MINIIMSTELKKGKLNHKMFNLKPCIYLSRGDTSPEFDIVLNCKWSHDKYETDEGWSAFNLFN